MDIARKILAKPGSKVPSVEETLPTLCNRLQHATLSSDRKSAILGLKSFSRQYRESVVEYGLRPLVTALKRDYENADITKAILETLLILFIRGEGNEDLTRSYISHHSRVLNGKYPSPLLIDNVEYDQFSLWIADALTQDPSTFELVLNIIQDNDDFHIKLYSIQLLEAVVSARPARAKDCLLNVPTSTSILVSLLKDPRDPIRNEAILLLMAIVKDNFNIQKLVAFENTFDILFDIIQDEIGIRGSLLVQDCLSLINNLLQYNASNQKYFIETQGIPRLNELMNEPLEEAYEDDLKDSEGNPIPIPPIHWTEQRLKNMSLALDICKALVSDDNESLAYNQEKLTQAGVLFTALRLTFSPNVKNETRLSALLVVCDIIRGNHEIQLQLETIDVPYIDPSLPLQLQTNDQPVPVIISLINWALCINSVHCFDLRVAASKCLHAYLYHNNEAKRSFLLEQMDSYKDPAYFAKLLQETSGDEEENHSNSALPVFANVFSVLMDYDTEVKINPYRSWFAAVILTYIIEEDEEGVFLDMITNFKTGDESSGEEVLSSIQAISGSLITTLENYDERVPIGYLMLLSLFLFENSKGVDDFLADPSVVRSLLTYLSKSADQSVLVQGVAAFFIGIVFEFSTRDSPISRVSLHGMIVQSLGKSNFSLKVRQLKENPLFRNFTEGFDYESEKEESGLPELYFVSDYVNLVKDNYNRISKALVKDPNFETIKKISYDDFQELSNKYQELEAVLSTERSANKLQEEALNKLIEDLNAQYNETQTQLEQKSKELEKLKVGHSGIERDYEQLKAKVEELEKLKDHFEDSSNSYYKELSAAKKIASSSDGTMRKLQMDYERASSEKKKMEEGINKMTRDLFQLQKQKQTSETNLRSYEKEILNLKKELQKVKKDHDSKMEKLSKNNKDLELKVRNLTEKLASESRKAFEANALSKDLQTKVAIEAQNSELLMNKLRSAATTYNELKKTKQEVENEVRFLKAKVASLEVASIELLNANGKQQSQIDVAQNGSQSKLAEFRQAFESLTVTNLALETKQIEMEEEIRVLQSDQNEEQEAYEALIVELENKVKELSAENKLLLESLAALETENKLLVSSKDLLNEEFQKFKETLAELKSAKESEVSEYKEEMKKEINEFQAKQDELEHELKLKTDENSKTKLELESNLSKLTELELEHRSNLSKIEIKYDDIKHQLETKVVEYNSAVERLALQERQLSEMQEQQHEKVEQYEQKLSEVRESLHQKQKELDEANESLKTTENTLKGLQINRVKEAEAFEKRNKQLESLIEVNRKQLEVSVSPEALEETKKKISNEFSSKLSDVRLELELKIQAYQKLEAQLNQSTASVNELQQQHDSQSAEFNKKLEELNKLTVSYSELQVDYNSIKDRLQLAQSVPNQENKELLPVDSSKVQELERLLSSKEADINSLRAHEQSLNQQLASLSEQNKRFEHSLFAASENQTILEKSKHEVETELQALQYNFNQLQEAHSALLSGIPPQTDAQEVHHEADDSLIAEHQAEVNQLRATVSNLESELASMNAKHEETTKQLEDLQAEILALKEKQNEVSNAYQNASKSHEESLDMVKQIANLEEQLSQARDELNTTRASLQVANEAVSKHESDVKEFEASYEEIAAILEKTKSNYDNLKTQLNVVESEHQAKLETSRLELMKLNELISELKEKETTHLKQTQEQHQKITELEEKVEMLNKEKNVLQVSLEEETSKSNTVSNGIEAKELLASNGHNNSPEDIVKDPPLEVFKMRSELESKVTELQQALQQKEELISEAEKDSSNLQVEIDTVTHRLEQATAELDKLKEVIQAKEDLLAEKETNIADLEEENDSVTDMMEKLNIVKLQLEGELKDLTRRMQPQVLDDKEHQILALKDDLMLKIESLGLKDLQIDKLQKKLDARVRDYEKLSNENHDLKEDISIKNDQIKVYESQIKAMEKTLSKNSGTVQQLESSCTTLRDENGKLEDALASFKQEILRLTKELEELQKSHDSQSKKANEREVHFSSLGEKYKEAETRVVQLSQDYQTKVQAIESERLTFEEKISELESKYSNVEKEWESKLKNAELSSSKQISALESEKAKLETQFAAQLQELSDAQSSLQKLSLELSQLQERHEEASKEKSIAESDWESKFNSCKEKYDKEILIIESEKESLSSELQQKSDELSQTKLKLSECTSQITSLSGELERSTGEKSTIVVEWESKFKDLEDLSAKTISDITKERDAALENIELKQKLLSETSEKLSSVSEELEKLQLEFHSTRELNSSTILEWEAKVKSIQETTSSELATVSDERDALKEQLTNKEQELVETTNLLEKISESLADAENTLKLTKEEHSATIEQWKAQSEGDSHAKDNTIQTITSARDSLAQDLQSKQKELEGAQAELSALQNEYKDAAAKHDLALDKLRSRFEEKLEVNSTEIELLKSDKEEIQNQLDTKLQELSTLTAQLETQKEAESALSLERDSSVKQIELLEIAKAELTTELELKKQELASLESNAKEISQKLKALEAELTVKTNDHQKVLELHQNTGKELSTKDSEIAELQQSLSLLKADTETQNQKMLEVQTANESLSSALESSKEEVIVLTKKLDEADKLQIQLDEVSKKNQDETGVALDSLRAELEQLKSDISALKDQVDIKQKEIDLLTNSKHDLEEAATQLDALQEQIKKLETDLLTLRNEYDSQMDSINRLEAEKDELSNRLEGLDETQADHERSISEWKAKCEDMDKVVNESSKLLSELERKEKVISTKDEETLQLKQQITQLQDELNQQNEVALEFRNEALKLSDTLAGLRSELNEAKEKSTSEQNDQQSEYQKQIEVLQKQVSELSNSKAEMEELNNKISLLEFEVLDKDDNVHILEEQLKNLFASKEELQQKSNQRIEQLEAENKNLQQNDSEAEEVQLLRAQNEKLRDGLIKVKGLLVSKSEAEHELEEAKHTIVEKDNALEAAHEQIRILQEKLNQNAV